MQCAQPSDRGDNPSSYICNLRGIPMFSAEAVRALCHRWRNHDDICAVRQLVDPIGEGRAGPTRALRRFDLNCGVHFATYVISWLGAAIPTDILRNWSLVKMSADDRFGHTPRGGSRP